MSHRSLVALVTLLAGIPVIAQGQTLEWPAFAAGGAGRGGSHGGGPALRFLPANA
jgi:hypothetical protein